MAARNTKKSIKSDVSFLKTMLVALDIADYLHVKQLIEKWKKELEELL